MEGTENTQIVAPAAIVGVGASAGGLEALEALFDVVPAASGLSWVVVQHLSPDYRSLMPEILSRHTTLPVLAAEDGVLPRPDTIYLLPPRMQIELREGRLRLSERAKGPVGVPLPIDVFLHSLAEELGERGVAIVLSGTGSDGMRGVRALKEAGGLVLAQDESTARFNGMPRSAISTGVVDYVLPPGEMPPVIVNYLRFLASAPPPGEPVEGDDKSLAHVLAMLRRHTGVDFSEYKPSTIRRRVERRMGMHQIATLSEYARFVERTRRELSLLCKDMLIGVTRFFRDPETWEVVRNEVIPKILDAASPREPVRVWTPACATGEEAYTLAILFAEAMAESRRAADVKIFATDIDRDAVAYASAGVYPESIAADVSPERLARWFVPRGEEIAISRPIRQMVLFAQHNVTKDPPFIRLDLVSCRNLLIYLEAGLQRRVLQQLHFGLKPSRWLLLGSSETTGDLEGYRVADPRAKIYVTTPGPRPPVRDEVGLAPTSGRWAHEGRGSATEEATAIEIVQREVTAEFVPLSLLVNEQHELVHVIGDSRGLLQIPAGAASLGIEQLLPRGLSAIVGAALHRVRREQEPAVYPRVAVGGEDDPGLVVDVFVRPVAVPQGDRRFLLVVLARHPNVPAAELPPPDAEAEARVADLQHELLLARENLQATVEELQTSNEELQASNEELVSANEELQSTNEELQSLNEELHTVNAEYEAKIAALVQLTDDMDNLLTSTEIGALFLDGSLAIRKYTPAVRRQVNLLERDLGRPVEHLSFNFDDPGFFDDLRRVLQGGPVVERALLLRDGGDFLLRILPYRTREGTPEAGVVVTFVDVSALRVAERRLQAVLDSLPDPVAVLNASGVVAMANPAWSQMGVVWPGVAGPGLVGRPYPDICRQLLGMDTGTAKRLYDGVNAVLERRADLHREVHPRWNGGQREWLLVRATPLSESQLSGVLVSHTTVPDPSEPAS